MGSAFMRKKAERRWKERLHLTKRFRFQEKKGEKRVTREERKNSGQREKRGVVGEEDVIQHRSEEPRCIQKEGKGYAGVKKKKPDDGHVRARD